MRVTIYLPDDELQALDRLCQREGLTRAEAVRRAVRLLLASDSERDAAVAVGGWRDKAIDGVAYQRAIRAEWNRD
jgi:Arc/MetJ-type ribon-helix-helix transcriptional regulator